MLKAAALIAAKDLRLLASGSAGIAQPLLFGLMLIFVFSLSLNPGDVVTARTAATIFWLASAFCLILAANMAYALEQRDGARVGLLLAPMPVQAVWLGKALGILGLLLLAQACFMPAIIAFLRQHPGLGPTGLGGLFLTDAGLAALASLLGALAQGRSARESLLSIVFFPLMIPALLAGIEFVEQVFSPGSTGSASGWLGIILAFDAVFLAAGLVLFPFLYTDED